MRSCLPQTTSKGRHLLVMSIWTAFLLALAAALLSPIVRAAPTEEEAVLAWVQASLKPLPDTAGRRDAGLAAVGQMIGDARIVVLGEGAHGAAQPLEFRNDLFRYLVEKKGFTAIAIESGVVEGRVVQDYVQGTEGQIDDVLARGLSWTLDDFPQNKALVQWMHSYNQAQAGRPKLSFWGFDIPGSPGNRFARRGVQTALDESLAYLRRVDAQEAKGLEAGIQRMLPLSVNSYGALTQADRDQLAATVSRLVQVMRTRRAAYVAASSSSEYEWAYRSALSAERIDQWLRPIPMDWKPENGFSWSEKSLVPRHQAMVENLDWILTRLRKGERVLIFSALTHVATAPLRLSDAAGPQVPAGIAFKRRFGRRMVTIGNVVSDGKIGNCASGPVMTLRPPPATSFSQLLAAAGVPEYAVDLRSAPPVVRAYLSRPRELWNGFATMSLVVPRSFDIAHFSGPLKPACPVSSH